MAKQIEEWETTKEGTEGGGSNNNIFQTTAEKGVSNDNYPNGFGLSTASPLKPFENVAGLEAIEQKALKDREMARFASLAPAMGMDVKISNAGIVLDIVDAGYGQGGAKPNVQNGALK